MAKYCSLLMASVFFSALGLPISGEWKISVETIDSAPRIGEDSERLIRYAAKGLPGRVIPVEALDENVRGILKKDIIVMETLFQGDWDPPLGAVTATVDSADVLVVVWRASPAYPQGVVLWDHPDFNLVLFEVDSAMLGQPSRIEEFLETAIERSGSPLDFQEALLWVTSDQKLDGVVGTGSVVYRNGPAGPIKGYEFRIFAFRAKTNAFITFRCGKNLVKGTYEKGGSKYGTATIYDPGMIFVPERFPPLADRIRQVEKGTLMSELGRSPERDGILLDELFRQGLERNEFRSLMLIGEPTSDTWTDQRRQQRIGLVLDSLMKFGEDSSYEAWVRESVSYYDTLGDEGLPMLQAVVGGMTGVKGIDLSDVVIGVMREGKLFEVGLRYLKFRGSTPEVLEGVSGLAVPTEYESYKKSVLEAIQERIRLAEVIKRNSKRP